MDLVSYEWDDAKRVENLAKHGIDFTAASEFAWATAYVRPDLRRDYGEPRFQAIGLLRQRIVVLVFTPRNGAYRLISFRPANSRERKAYEQACQGA